MLWLKELGIQNFWQITFLLLTMIIIACNIALMFVPEELSTERQIEQKKTDQFIVNKLGSSNSITNIFAWVIGTITGPFVSFFKSKGIKIGICKSKIGFQPFLSKIKHLNRLEQVIARSEWETKKITEYKTNDFKLLNYDPHPTITASMNV